MSKTSDGNALEAMLAARKAVHGDFNDHARITQNLKAMVQNEKTYGHLTAAHREALEMILHKIGRIMAGDPHYRDHWDDISGYARLAADRVRTTQDGATP